MEHEKPASGAFFLCSAIDVDEMLPIFYRLPLMHQDLDNITGNRRFHLIDYVECFNSCYELPHLDTITHSYQSASPGFGRCMKDPYKMRRNMMLCFYRCGSGCGCNKLGPYGSIHVLPIRRGVPLLSVTFRSLRLTKHQPCPVFSAFQLQFRNVTAVEQTHQVL